MVHAAAIEQLPSSRRASVRMQTLNMLRWLAISGQSVAVFVAVQFLDVSVPLDRCAMLIGLSAAFTAALTLIHPQTKRFTTREAALTLLFDLSQLGAMLYLTGGLNNPFSVLVLVQTTISAAVLTLKATLALGAVTVSVISVLAVFHQPLRTADGTVLQMPDMLILGIWASLLIGVLFLGVFAWRVTQETYGMAEALAATQLALERERKLTALGGMVAAAAHELGTPLATIKLTSTELASDLDDCPHLREDVELIRAQADRCRDILRRMGQIGEDDAMMRSAPLGAVVEEAADPHLDRGIDVVVRTGAELDDDTAPQPGIPRRPEIIHGLRNLIQNAVDFAQTTVWIDLYWDDRIIRVTVGDDGPGFPADLLGRIGDPFVRRRQRARGADSVRPGYDGMGLGLFIAKTLLERTGARLTFVNGRRTDAPRSGDPHLPAEMRQPSGAIVDLVWARTDLLAGGN